MKKQQSKTKIPYLDYMCKVGETVQWIDLTEKKFIGKLIAMDEDSLATVELNDGSIIHYQC